MGLDQFAVGRRGEKFTDDEGYEYYDENIELAYWRKHPNLQGWMERLWNEKDCPNDDGDGFNGVNLELTLDDLDDLEESLDEKALPETAGFFFGGNADDHYAEADREFIKKAREAIEDGYIVVYTSSW